MQIIKTPINPDSECWLINVPWDSTYNDVYAPHGATHALRRSTAATYFEGLKSSGLHIEDLKPVRRSWAFKIHAKYYDIVNKYNYVILAEHDARFTDENNQAVYQYCFIADVAYVNDDMVEISVITDYWTQFYTMAKTETTFKGQQFINRMHVCDDTPLKWKAEEGYQPYQYIQTNEQYLGYWDTDNNQHLNFGADRNIVCIFTSGEVPQDVYNGVPASHYEGTELIYHYTFATLGFRGCTKPVGQVIMCANLSRWFREGGTLYSCNASEVDAIVDCFNGNPDQVIAIKAIPFEVLASMFNRTTGEISKLNYIGNGQDLGITLTITPLINNIFDGYIPHNNKLFNSLTLSVSNNCGNVNDFKIIDFYGIDNPRVASEPGYPWDIKFKVFSDFSPNADCVLYPCNYQHKPFTTGDSINLSYPLTMGLCGSIPWTNNSYKMWLAQQGGEDTLRAMQANANSLIDNGMNQSLASNQYSANQAMINRDTARNQYNFTTAGLIDKTGLREAAQNLESKATNKTASNRPKTINSSFLGSGGFGASAGGSPTTTTKVTVNATSSASNSALDIAMTALEGALGGSARAGMLGAERLYTLSQNYASSVAGYIRENSNLQKEAIDLQYNAMFKGAQAMPNVYNATTSSVVESFNGKGFFAYIMAMSKYDARHLDNYFDMYGYTINEYTPNMNIYTKNPMFSRDVFNYVRLTDCHLNKVSNGTESETRVLEEIFNNGVRVWHNTTDLATRNTLVTNGVKTGHSDNILGVDT